MKKIRIINVVGARPNFMKMAPVLRELSQHDQFDSCLVHTGQHYDELMSQVFFKELDMPQPDFNLDIGSASHAVQTAECMKRFEQVCCSVKPELVIVAGDVNSTLACSLTAVKLQIPIAHIESGLRSFDRTMPEEINRIVTDSVADLLFTTEESGNANLRREGVSEKKIYFVGNTMIDSLVQCHSLLHGSHAQSEFCGVPRGAYFLATIHRPSNVDEPAQLVRVLDIMRAASQLAPVLFVAHPRTCQRLQQLKSTDNVLALSSNGAPIQTGSIYLAPPLAYLQFLRVMTGCKAVLTDSGGIQEETTFLGIPCLTLRDNTERPITVEQGSNEIVGLDRDKIMSCLNNIMAARWKRTTTPPLWDGAAAQRVAQTLLRL